MMKYSFLVRYYQTGVICFYEAVSTSEERCMNVELACQFELDRPKYEGAFLSARNNMITVSTFCTHD